MPSANPCTRKSKTGLAPAQAIAAFCLMLSIGGSAGSASLRVGDLPQRLVAELASGTVTTEVVDGSIESYASSNGMNVYAFSRGATLFALVQYETTDGTARYSPGLDDYIPQSGPVFVEAPLVTGASNEFVIHLDLLTPGIPGSLFVSNLPQARLDLSAEAMAAGTGVYEFSGDPDYIESGTMTWADQGPDICIECTFDAQFNLVYLDYSDGNLRFDFDDPRTLLFTGEDGFDTVPYNWGLDIHVDSIQPLTPLGQWSETGPRGPDNAVGGGHVVRLEYGEGGEAYLLPFGGELYKRAAAGDPWQPVDVIVDGEPVRLRDVDVGPGTPPVLLGRVGSRDLVRSVDGGATWTSLGQPATRDMRAFVTARDNPELIYLSLNPGTMRSVDGGQTFVFRHQSRPSSPYSALAVHPLSSSQLYATGNGNHTLLISADGGLNWSFSESGFAVGENTIGLGLDPTGLQVLYAGTSDNRIYKSLDGGGSWTAGAVLDDPVRAIAVDPVDTTKIYAAATEFPLIPPRRSVGAIFRSADAGNNWSRVVGAGLGNFHALDIAADGEIIAAGTASVLTSTDGITWVDSTAGFNHFPVSDFAVAPGDEQVLYAVSRDSGGIIVSTDSGRSWDRREGAFGPLGYFSVAVDPTDAMHAYAAGYAGLVETFDGGISWNGLDLGPVTPGLFASTIVIAPADPDRLYVLANGVGTSDDGGATWTQAAVDATQTSTCPRMLSVSPTDPATVYLGSTGNGLRISTDAGASWTQISDALPNPGVYAIAEDPADSQRIVLGLTEGKVVQSLDGGDSWEDISFDLPTSGFGATLSIAIDPFGSGTTYAVVLSDTFTLLPYRLLPGATQWQLIGDLAIDSLFDLCAKIHADPARPGRVYFHVQEQLLVFDFDSDADGIVDGDDNCLGLINPDQRDTDGDLIGNRCDPDIAPAVNDCQVDMLDLQAMRAGFFASGDADTDLDGDGFTNFADLKIMAEFFLGAPGPSGLTDCAASGSPWSVKHE